LPDLALVHDNGVRLHAESIDRDLDRTGYGLQVRRIVSSRRA
jgi:hypothetical protein